MRQMIVRVPAGEGRSVVDIARRHGGTTLAHFDADGPDGRVALAIVHTPNAAVGGLIEDLQEIPSMHVVLAPQGVLTLQPPASEAPEQVTDVTYRSPIEVLLSGMQSVGSWGGFLGYAAAAGAVVWIGLFTNTMYLLTAAMLIAPFAGPAMNAAIATARGDVGLLRRNLLRYSASLMVTIVVAGVLSLVLRQKVATQLMVETSDLSSTAVLLPLVAGAAGALNLVQSQRSSLVSGAATGMLVAASLAPPAGLIGMAAVIGRWEMVVSGLFVLLLQIAGINLSGALVFRTFGISAHGPRYARGQAWAFPMAAGAAGVMLAALLTWQFWSPPHLQRSTREQRAAASIQDVVEASGLAQLVEANVRFTRADIPEQNTLLAVLFVQVPPRGGSQAAPPDTVRTELTERIRRRLRDEGFDVTALVDVTVLQPDGG